MKWIVFGGSRGFETYCRDETDPIELSGGSDFVADYWNWHLMLLCLPHPHLPSGVGLRRRSKSFEKARSWNFEHV